MRLHLCRHPPWPYIVNACHILYSALERKRSGSLGKPKSNKRVSYSLASRKWNWIRRFAKISSPFKHKGLGEIDRYFYFSRTQIEGANQNWLNQHGAVTICSCWVIRHAVLHPIPFSFLPPVRIIPPPFHVWVRPLSFCPLSLPYIYFLLCKIDRNSEGEIIEKCISRGRRIGCCW